MANQAFDRTVINVRERPLSSDINQAQSQLDRTIRETLMQSVIARSSGSNLLAGSPPDGFFGSGFRVVPSSPTGLSLKVTAGMGFYDLSSDLASALNGIIGVDDLSRFKPLSLLADTTINGIPAGPASGSTRIDIVEVRMNRLFGNSLSRDTLDVSTGQFVPGNVNKTLSFTQDGSIGIVSDPAASTDAISYKVGVVNGSEPTATPGYVKIASVFATGGNMTSAISKANIIDKRQILCPYGLMNVSGSFSVPNGSTAPPTSVSLNAPPGIECVVVKTAAPAQNQFDIFLLGGALGSNAAGHLTAHALSAYNAGQFYHTQFGGSSVGTLNSGQVSSIADATLSAPASTFPVGFPYFKTSIFVHRQASGVTDATVTDPLQIVFGGHIQRY